MLFIETRTASCCVEPAPDPDITISVVALPFRLAPLLSSSPFVSSS